MTYENDENIKKILNRFGAERFEEMDSAVNECMDNFSIQVTDGNLKFDFSNKNKEKIILHQVALMLSIDGVPVVGYCKPNELTENYFDDEFRDGEEEDGKDNFTYGEN